LIELRELVAEQLYRLYGAAYDPKSELLITVGVSEALDLAMRAVINPGDEIIVPDPGYVSYAPTVTLAGGVVVPVPTYEADDFKIQAKAIESVITPRTKALLLGYPNNPTGAELDRADLMEIAKLAHRHNLLVISDEIYDRLVYDCEHTCFASLPGMKERTILLGGFSKAYAMTGWRLGWAATTPEIMQAMVKIHQYTIMSAPTMAQLAAIEALKHGEPLVQEMVADYNRRRRVMVKGLRDIGLNCFEPKGAFYAFPDISSTGLRADEFAERLLREAKVVVVPGEAFGSCGANHVRCCYATSLQEIQEALERIGGFVEKVKKG
jgi:aminotransferase